MPAEEEEEETVVQPFQDEEKYVQEQRSSLKLQEMAKKHEKGTREVIYYLFRNSIINELFYLNHLS